jgi:hypothetical protein
MGGRSALVSTGGLISCAVRGELEGGDVFWERAWAAHALAFDLPGCLGHAPPSAAADTPARAAAWCAMRAFERLTRCGYGCVKPAA